MSKFRDIFSSKTSIIGMLHLAGDDPVERALEEAVIYSKVGIDGVIVEDFHGNVQDVEDTLETFSKVNFPLEIGVNVLSEPYSSFEIADLYGASFVQFDSMQSGDLEIETYKKLRSSFPNICVLGGVRFKYKSSTGRSLEEDLAEAVSLCDAIVTTGEGTGKETPIEKLRDFRRVLGNFPLIVGAGVNENNISEQSKIVDGAIIGSAFKPYSDTTKKVDKNLVRKIARYKCLK